MNLDNLIRLKIEVLFHDPPNKSFLIDVLGDNFGTEHEEHAKKFKRIVLTGTRFEAAGAEEIRRLARFCDVAASTIERRLLRLKYWPKGKYLKYNKLHNIFDPVSDGISLILSDSKLIDKIGEELNDILNKVYTRVDDVTFYNILYITYEVLWYKHGLPPSLADTRTPTHTIFDHLYSCATIANAVVGDGNEFKLGGFYVVIDFPGIQRFVGSGRKASDFWASSWLLSNVMWGIAEYFTKKYGFDTVITPTPRLNPYTLKSIESWLSNLSIEEDAKKIIEEVISKLKNAFTEALKISMDELEEFMNQPIIPATISLLLPAIDLKDSEDVIKEVSKAYVSSWGSIVEKVLNELGSKAKAVWRVVHDYLSKTKDIISLPPYGVRIFIVDISKLYDAITNCVVNGDLNVCNDLGLSIDIKKLTSVIKSSGINYDDVILILLWHLMTTKAIYLASKFGNTRIPTPRPFWIFSDNTLKPISDTFLRQGSWEPCILCNSEPAIMRLSKKVVKKDGREEIDFEEDIGLSGEDRIEFKKHFKPGEALGPYCLLKRAIYMVNMDKEEDISTIKSKPIKSTGIRFVSTDDVLLEGTSNILVRLDKTYKFLSRLRKSENLKKFKDEEIFLIETLLKPRLKPEVEITIKDVDIIATTLGTTYDGLINLINKSIFDECKKLSEERKDEFISACVKELMTTVLGEKYVKALPNELKVFVENPSVIRVDGLCKAISIPKTFAIVRCDGDNIGKFLSGEGPLGLNEYLEKLLTIIEDAVKTSGISEDVLNYVRDGFNTLKELLSSLGFKYIPVTPARTAAMSLALMISAISDLRIIKDGYGMVIFSGGDDVLALTPSQTALRIATELRSSFSDEYFRQVGNVIVPTIPTGRSVSIRFVSIADLMNYELGKTLELLEDLGKECKWIINEREYPKDTLVISDSRIGISALLPLHKEFRGLTETALIISFLVGIGTLSSNTPNDFISIVKDPKLLSGKSLEILSKYVMRRNVVTSSSAVRKLYAEKLIELLTEWFSKSSNSKVLIGDDESNLITEVMKLLMIMRREL